MVVNAKRRASAALPSPTFVGYATSVESNDTSTSISVDLSALDSGGPITAGDLCIIHVVQDFSGTDGIDSGFECIYELRSVFPVHSVYAKELTGSETTVSVSFDTTAGYALLIAVVYRDAEIRQLIPYIPSGNETSASFPSLPCSGGDSLVHICAGVDDDIVTDFAAPSGYTLQVSETVGTSGSGCSAAVATKSSVAAGDESPGDITGTFSDPVVNVAIEIVSKGRNSKIVSGITEAEIDGPSVTFTNDLPKSGDLILVIDTNLVNTGAPQSPPATISGYTSILTDTATNNSIEAGCRVQYKIADGTETGVTLNSSTNDGVWFLFRSFGGDTLGIGQSASRFTSGSSTSIPTPSLTGLNTGGTGYVAAFYIIGGSFYSDVTTAYPLTIGRQSNGVAGNTSASIGSDTLIRSTTAFIILSFGVEITVT